MLKKTSKKDTAATNEGTVKVFGFDTNSVMRNIKQDEKEGVDYINISTRSESELGKRLAPGYIKTFTTFLGRTNSVKSFMSAISIPGYDLNLLSKTRITKEDIAKIPNEVVDVPNYWAMLAYVLCMKIQSDRELIQLIKDNDLPYTSIGKPVNKQLFNVVLSVSSIRHDMIKYVAIVNEIAKLIKADKFEDDNILEFVNACKFQPDLEVWEGIACADKLTKVNDSDKQPETTSVSDESEPTQSES